MVRGTGKFKQKRGGGRNFSKNMTLDANGTAIGEGTIYNRRGPRKNDDDDDDSEEGSEEESEEDSDEESESEDDAVPVVGGSKAPEPELSRVERRELKKKQAAQKQAALEDDEDADLINPNHVEKKLNISSLGAPRELSRREREQKEKADAKDRYWKLHVQGKTVEAKADLSRLAKIRAEREAAQAKRKAEADAKTAEIEAKKQAQVKRG